MKITSSTVSKISHVGKDVVNGVLDTVSAVAKNIELPKLPDVDISSVIDSGTSLVTPHHREKIRQTAKAFAKGLGRHMGRMGDGFGKGVVAVGNGFLENLGATAPPASPVNTPAPGVDWPETFLVIAALLVLSFGGFLVFLLCERRRAVSSRRHSARRREIEFCQRYVR